MEVTLSAASTTIFPISKTLVCSSQTSRNLLTLLHPRRITTTANALFQRPSIKFTSKSPFFGGKGIDGGADGGKVKANPISAVADDVSPLSSDVIILDVKGMTCGGCSSSVQRILENQAQVSSASVDLKKEMAVVRPVSEAMDTPNWQKVIGEELAKELTTCGFDSTVRG